MNIKTLFYSSKLDVWMVFCVIFVFGTLLEFALLIALQKQVFDAKIKKSLTELSMETTRAGNEYGKRRSIIRNSNSMRRVVKQMRGVTDLIGATAGLTSAEIGPESFLSATTTNNEAKENNCNTKNGNKHF